MVACQCHLIPVLKNYENLACRSTAVLASCLFIICDFLNFVVGMIDQHDDQLQVAILALFLLLAILSSSLSQFFGWND